MEYEVPYTSTVLMEKLGLKSKETFRKNYMNPAMQLQLVQMTIPEKPKSRNQRYIRRIDHRWDNSTCNISFIEQIRKNGFMGY
ncbi:Fic family protein [[Clostridium] scindens]|uniref:Fic family protein n=1 Tax=Lachnospiraceae TaxID=186803 RepID=UPI002FE6DFA3